jgi:hypothetical protein
MNVTLSLDEQLVKEARKRAEAVGKSLNQVIREHLEQLTGKRDAAADVEEFIRLLRESKGNSRGWKFNREEIHDRKW